MSEAPQGWWARHIDSVYRLALLALILLWIVYPPHAAQPGSGAHPVSPLAASTP